jgi:hypothetical protein
MKRKRFTEEQIIGVLKEHELGANTADLCRKHGALSPFFGSPEGRVFRLCHDGGPDAPS